MSLKSVSGDTQPEVSIARYGLRVTEILCLGFLIGEMGRVIVPTGQSGPEWAACRARKVHSLEAWTRCSRT